MTDQTQTTAAPAAPAAAAAPTSPAAAAVGQAVDTAKTDVAAAAARRPWTVIAWAAAAGVMIGLILGSIFL